MKKKRSGKKVWGMSEVRKVEAGNADEFRKMLGPGAVDQMVRHALQMCWIILPDSPTKVDDVEREFRRVVDRALRDQREDHGKFPPVPGH